MTNTVRQLRICIASPGDCNDEREVVRRIIKDDPTIRTLCRQQDVSLDVFGWEDVSPGAGRPQSLINAAMEERNPDLFVFLFWHRFGSDAGLGMTGTEEEWNRALIANKQGGGHPAISIYFKRANPPFDALDTGQLASVEDFRSTVFAERQALAKEFHDPDTFRDMFRAHLAEKIHGIEANIGELGSAPEVLRQEFADTSHTLLSWPRDLGNGERLERPERVRLASKILNSESSTTLVLGGRGTGKSALLADLGHHLLDEGVALLAIKADMIAATVENNEGCIVSNARSWLLWHY